VARESLIRRAARVLRRDGPGALVLAVLRHTVYQRVNLIEHELTGEIPVVRCEVPFQVRRLAARTSTPTANSDPGSSPAEIEHRLERGSVCYVAWHAGRIVSGAWYHAGEAWIEDVDRRFDLGADTVYSYDAHTVPELRGRRVTPARSSIALADLRDSGFRRGVAFVVPGNRAGDRSRVRSGRRRFGVAGYLHLGLARIEFVRTRGRQAQWHLRWLLSPGDRRREPPPLESGAPLTG
jgi:hypothetical protein